MGRKEGLQNYRYYFISLQKLNVRWQHILIWWCWVVGTQAFTVFSAFFFFPHCVACGFLVPWTGIEPTPPAVEARSLNHWKAREVTVCSAIFDKFKHFIMDLEGIILSEICQRKTNTIWYHLYVEYKKYNKQVNITKKKQALRYREQTSGYQCWRDNTRVGEWEVQTIGCKTGYREVLHNMRNIANIL